MNETKQSKISLWFKNLSSKILLKKTDLDYRDPFLFKMVDYKTVGLVFISTAIVIPFVLSISIRFLFTDITANTKLFLLFIQWVSTGLGASYVLNNARMASLRYSAIAFYYFYYIPSLISLVMGLILGAAGVNSSNVAVMSVLNWIIAISSNFLCIFLIYRFHPYVITRIFNTLKENYKYVIIVSIVGLIFAFLLSMCFNLIQSQISSETSDNQKQLEDGLKGYWWNWILLFISACIFAPIIEEIACRHAIFLYSGNAYIGYFASIIYFAGMHVSQFMNWEQFVGYLGGSIALTSIFIYTRANVTYSIIVHSLSNLITFILMVLRIGFNINLGW